MTTPTSLPATPNAPIFNGSQVVPQTPREPILHSSHHVHIQPASHYVHTQHASDNMHTQLVSRRDQLRIQVGFPDTPASYTHDSTPISGTESFQELCTRNPDLGLGSPDTCTGAEIVNYYRRFIRAQGLSDYVDVSPGASSSDDSPDASSSADGFLDVSSSGFGSSGASLDQFGTNDNVPFSWSAFSTPDAFGSLGVENLSSIDGSPPWSAFSTPAAISFPGVAGSLGVGYLSSIDVTPGAEGF